MTLCVCDVIDIFRENLVWSAHLDHPAKMDER